MGFASSSFISQVVTTDYSVIKILSSNKWLWTEPYFRYKASNEPVRLRLRYLREDLKIRNCASISWKKKKSIHNGTAITKTCRHRPYLLKLIERAFGEEDILMPRPTLVPGRQALHLQFLPIPALFQPNATSVVPLALSIGRCFNVNIYIRGMKLYTLKDAKLFLK